MVMKVIANMISYKSYEVIKLKIILSLFQLCNGNVEKTKLQKLLFLYSQRKRESEYDFVPYKFGCYSYSANADLVIAVTGIAGPNGGSKDKPVGSVWIAWGSREKIYCHYFCIKANRGYFQHAVAARSLDLLRRLLIKSDNVPLYFS